MALLSHVTDRMAQLLCVALAVVSFSLQGCSTKGGDALNPETTTQTEARAMLMEIQQKCNAQCDEKCTYKSDDFWGHAREATECHMCLHTNCKDDFFELQSQIGQHWYEPVCKNAIDDAAVCWADVSECVQLETTCWTSGKGSCDFAKVGQCWLDYTTKCIERYLPCCYKDDKKSGESGEGSGGGSEETRSGKNECVDHGAASDAQCAQAHSWTPGKPIYAYRSTGSKSWQGCCTQKSANKCTIYLPGVTPIGEVYDCEAA